MDDAVRLDEFDKDEWFDVARRLKPGLSREDYEGMWEDFMAAKREHQRQRGLN